MIVCLQAIECDVFVLVHSPYIVYLHIRTWTCIHNGVGLDDVCTHYTVVEFTMTICNVYNQGDLDAWKFPAWTGRGFQMQLHAYGSAYLYKTICDVDMHTQWSSRFG